MELVEQRVLINENGNVPDWHATIKRLSFQKRVCSKFIPQKNNRECCGCNNPAHTGTAPEYYEKWYWEKHTEPKPSECYGTFPYSNCPV
ncbi:unnamed protein product [Rotaria socialis]|uniref:Uncharacterized protein n=1 Tax=Rotaria socialis TaxID=392032 RepID=A0A818C961_9BILA|nr:unnamed protein product [Rotaria socialis]CAF3424598.1 unnamed protein product [Rotaria socialis]CAF3473748.1 unnamed protein product [Rotaria socialis]CAF3490278.1 unnamed protein product [Rotaria socialis]CAF3692231.1 unnamed protein product [Rotaria socialis]